MIEITLEPDEDILEIRLAPTPLNSVFRSTNHGYDEIDKDTRKLICRTIYDISGIKERRTLLKIN